MCYHHTINRGTQQTNPSAESPVFFLEVNFLKQSSRAGDIVLALFFYVPVVWGALLIAQSLGRGLPELLTNLATALQHPLDIHWTDKSMLSILICTSLYIMVLCNEVEPC